MDGGSPYLPLELVVHIARLFIESCEGCPVGAFLTTACLEGVSREWREAVNVALVEHVVLIARQPFFDLRTLERIDETTRARPLARATVAEIHAVNKRILSVVVDRLLRICNS